MIYDSTCTWTFEQITSITRLATTECGRHIYCNKKHQDFEFCPYCGKLVCHSSAQANDVFSHDKIAERFGTFLLDARQTRNLSRGDIARAVGISPSNIYNYEMGYFLPSLHNALMICAFLDVSIYDALDLKTPGGDGNV